MATYNELFDLRADSTLKNRITVACIIAAETIRTELDTVPNHALRLTWAQNVFASPDAEASRMMMALLAQNAALSVSAIQGVTDAQLQTGVNNAVNLFAAAIGV